MFSLFGNDRFLFQELLGEMVSSKASSERKTEAQHLYFAAMERALKESGISVERIRMLALVTAALTIAAGFAYPSLFIFILPVVVAIITATVVKIRIRRTRLQLERDLPALITAIASSVRAGLDPLIAISRSREYFDKESVIGAELERFHSALSGGEHEEIALTRFAEGIQHPDLELLRSCILLSRKHGCSLADPLHRVTRVVRQRQSFRRKTRGALAMHRMSSIGIVMCAVLITGIQAVMNLDGMQQAISHPVGSKMIILGGALIVTGVVWMMSLGREASS